MNDNNPQQVSEFVLRRFTDPVNLFGYEIVGATWIAVLAVLLLVGFFYICWMYYRDSKGLALNLSGSPVLSMVIAILLVPVFLVLFPMVVLMLPVWVLVLIGFLTFRLIVSPPAQAAGASSLWNVGAVWISWNLGQMRFAVYLLLAAVFLLPATQTWEVSQQSSKVLVLVDTSLSMQTTKDDIPREGEDPASMMTRQMKVEAFLLDTKTNFLTRLEEKNPVTMYRFGRTVDEEHLLFTGGRNYFKTEYSELQKQLRNDPATKLPDAKPMPQELWTEFLHPVKTPGEQEDWGDRDKQRFKELRARNEKMSKGTFFTGTNLADAVLTTLKRETSNMVQGIVVVTDGRSTDVDQRAFAEIEQVATAAKIPIFVVGVGEDRPRVKIEITDLRAPELVQPEDKFRAIFQVTGEGLANKPFDGYFELTHEVKKGDKVELLPITVVEQIDAKPMTPPTPPKPGDKPEDKKPDDKPKTGEPITLGTKIVLKPEKPPAFDAGTPPQAEVEVQLDAYTLAKYAGQELDKGKKWELGETNEGEWVLRPFVPKDRLEVTAEKLHTTDPTRLRVLKKPLRVLLFASAATRDFQFTNNMLLREVDKKRVELAVHQQKLPGQKERRGGIVLGVDPKFMLTDFPDKLDDDTLAEDHKIYDLGSYDVVVAFDPDWSQLSPQQLKNLAYWVNNKGGGLVVVGGPIHTIQLARPGNVREQLKPVTELLPVTLKDIRIDELDRSTQDPWPLDLTGVTDEMEFFKLDENKPAGMDMGPPRTFKAAWDEFFYGPGDKRASKPERGFFNYYPIDTVKPGALVPARFTDPLAKMKDNTQMPYIVLSDPAGNRRVVWLAWGEWWRFRMYNEGYHERFWTKLLRYAAANSLAKVSRRINLYVPPTAKQNQPVDVTAKIDNKGGGPLPENAKVELTLKLPAGVPEREMPTKFTMRARKDQPGSFTTRFVVRSPGEYTVEVRVPESGDSSTRKFVVKEANPELDNTTPDFPAMYKLASEADMVLARMPEGDRNELKKRLQKPRLDVKADAPEPAVKDDKQRLYFDLKNAELIPSCMVTATKESKSRGPVRDYWDEGLTVVPDSPWGPIKISYVLVLAVGLLSAEWLIRKLLRLA